MDLFVLYLAEETSIDALIIVRSTGASSRTFLLQIVERAAVDLLGLVVAALWERDLSED